jgi:hypothetical protein
MTELEESVLAAGRLGVIRNPKGLITTMRNSIPAAVL